MRITLYAQNTDSGIWHRAGSWATLAGATKCAAGYISDGVEIWFIHKGEIGPSVIEASKLEGQFLCLPMLAENVEGQG